MMDMKKLQAKISESYSSNLNRQCIYCEQKITTLKLHTVNLYSNNLLAKPCFQNEQLVAGSLKH